MVTEGKTALVLSAGGMFGAYQAGVWEELSKVFDPDIVAGASAGSLNGWLIAAGARAEEITGRWRNIGPAGRIRWKMPRQWSDGWIDTTELDALIQDMCVKQPLVREYGVVLTELRTMKPRLFRTPEIDWRHVSASCSVPGFVRQHRIEGRYYSDGGVVDPLPLWAAVELGATTIVTVNVLKHRPWWIRYVVNGLQRYAGYRPAEPEGVRVVDISPSTRMGSARDAMYWSEANNERWIELGRRDARTYLERDVECWVRGLRVGEIRRFVKVPDPSHERVVSPAVPMGAAHHRDDDCKAEGL